MTNLEKQIRNALAECYASSLGPYLARLDGAAAAVARAANAMATEALGGEGESFERDALLRAFVMALGEKLEGA